MDGWRAVLRRLALAAGVVLCVAGCGNAPRATAPEPAGASLPSRSLSLQLETPHFSFYSTDADRPALPEMADLLESRFEEVTADLAVMMPLRIRVEVYPDLAAFHAVSPMPNAPDWFVGQALGSSLIRIVSPQNPGPAHSHHSILLGVVHEFVHAASAVANPSIGSVSWLSEGVALFEAGQKPERTTIAQAVHTGRVPSLADLSSYDRFVANQGYSFSYTIAEYVVAVYGRSALARLVRSPYDFTVLGPEVSKERFEEGWRTFLATAYGGVATRDRRE